MAKGRVRKGDDEAGTPNKYKLPYGLAKGLGLSTEGMTPTEVWNMLKAKGISPKEEYKKLGEEATPYLKNEETAILKEITTESIETPTTIQPALIDEETRAANEDNENKFSQERKDNAIWCQSDTESKSVFGAWQNDTFATATPEEREAAKSYTAGSGPFNKPLRGYTAWGKEGFKGVGNVSLDLYPGYGKQIEQLSDFIDKSISQQDCWLQRGDSYDGAKQLLGLMGNITEEAVQQLIDKGIDLTDNGFFSCGAAKGTGFSYKPITFNIYAPKGTKMLYVEGKSEYNGMGENEMILQRGTSFRATKVSTHMGRIYIDLEVREQNPLSLDSYKK